MINHLLLILSGICLYFVATFAILLALYLLFQLIFSRHGRG